MSAMKSNVAGSQMLTYVPSGAVGMIVAILLVPASKGLQVNS